MTDKNTSKKKLWIKNIRRLIPVLTVIIIAVFLSFSSLLLCGCKILPVSKLANQNAENSGGIKYLEGEEIILPEPLLKGDYSLEEALLMRASVRSFSDRKLEIEKISQLLWAAQGINRKSSGGRTAPSAGALYPLEIFIVVADGVYHYLPHEHKLMKIVSGDIRQKLSAACLLQQSVSDASADKMIAAIYERTTVKYGNRGERYVHMEAGHACQNILLTAVTLEIGAVPVGAFDDSSVQGLLNLPSNYMPLYVIPIGYPGK